MKDIRSRASAAGGSVAVRHSVILVCTRHCSARHFLRFSVVGAGVDSPIQPIFIENVESSPKPVELGFMAPHCLFARLLLSQIIGDELVLQPLLRHYSIHP